MATRIIKCLSVKNPLSYLIASGIKDVENRSWTTDYRGEIYIHSSGNYQQSQIWLEDLPDRIGKELKDKLVIEKDLVTVKDDCKYRDYIRQLVYLSMISNDYLDQEKDGYFRSRCIVGKVDLFDIVKNSNSPFAEEGFYHWILKNAVLFKKPVHHVKGKLKFFNFDISKIYNDLEEVTYHAK